MTQLDRRQALQGSAACVAGSTLAFSGVPKEERRFELIAFTKPFQDLSFDRLGEMMGRLGVDGIELPVRAKGHIEPERTADELPAAVETLKQHGVKVSTIVTDVVSTETPHAKRVLETAAKLRIPFYRMGYYRYRFPGEIPVIPFLDDLKPKVQELAAWNAELGIRGLYQNHSGPHLVGSAVWDLYRILEGIDPLHLGVAFDLGHATVEGGLTWPNHVALLRPWFGVLYAKDFTWTPGSRNPEWVPLGEGRTDSTFYSELRQREFRGPISIHVEHMRRSQRIEIEAAFHRDVKTMREYLAR